MDYCNPDGTVTFENPYIANFEGVDRYFVAYSDDSVTSKLATGVCRRLGYASATNWHWNEASGSAAYSREHWPVRVSESGQVIGWVDFRPDNVHAFDTVTCMTPAASACR